MEKSKQNIEKAREHLKIAGDELMKPEEDVVSFLVCKNSQYAMLHLLRTYLDERGYNTHEKETLQGLLDRCIKLNPEFKRVNIKTVDCRFHEIDSRYCDDVDKLSSCYHAANALDDFIRNI